MKKARRDEKYPENGFEEWGGYMNAKKSKLTEQFNTGASKESHLQATSKIFSGISVYVNGYTVPSCDEIKMAMMLNGGQFHQYYSASKTKFIIASNLAFAKLKKLKGHPKVVKPQWIADCVAAKKLLDFCPYLLYSNQTPLQPKIQFPQLSEFESPVHTPRFKELPVTSQKMTSTPKSSKVVGENPASQGNSLDLSGDIFDEPSTSGVKLDTSTLAELISSDSRESASSSDVSLFGEGNFAESTKLVQTSRENMEDELDDMFDCTLVAEELDEVEKIAEQSRISNLTADVTSDAARELLEETKLSVSSEVPALADQLHQSKEEEKPVQKDNKSNAPMKRAGESNFLAEFYSNSRLHHISTMGSTFKAYITELRKSHVDSGGFPGRAKLQQWKEENGVDRTWSGGKIIMHIDMDCFFVSVGLRSRPELEDQPVAVTHAKGNPPPGSGDGASRETEFELYKKRMEKKAGIDQSSENYETALEKRLTWRSDGSDRSSMSEIASCNYEARKAGLRNGMFLGQALKLCPNLQTIPYDFEGYKEVSYALYNTVASFTLDIEAVSCDEMFVDCTRLLKETNCHPLDFATFVRKEIKEITKCKASAGFGSNVLRARMATKKAKPDGQFYLQPEEVLAFMKDIQISDLPGVGRNLTFKMQTLGLQTCADLQKLPLSKVQSSFGQKLGTSLYKHCRGDDERVLEFEHVRKSVSAEVNYGIRFQTHEECKHFITELAQEVQARLEAIGKEGRCITLKLMVKTKEAPEETAKFMGHGVCNSLSKSANLMSETSDSTVIAREVMQMLGQMAIDFKLFRGIGVQMTKLTEKKKKKGRLSQFVTKGVPKQPQKPPTPVVAPEIDQDVLAELPEDIRQEILREYKLAPAPQEPIAGPSTSGSCFKSAAEISFSQVDPSFLDALPDNLKMELVAELKSDRTRRGADKVLFTGMHRSPVKVNSPKKKRGRPKGSKNSSSVKVSPKKKVHWSPMKVTVTESPEPSTIQNVVDSSSESEDEELVLRVNARLEDVLALVRDWVENEPEPTQIDIGMVLDFLNRLLEVKKLDKLQAVLQTIKMTARRKKSDVWTEAYSVILDGIQPGIVKKFGSKLKI